MNARRRSGNPCFHRLTSVFLMLVAAGAIAGAQTITQDIRVLTPRSGDTVERSFLLVQATGNFPLETVLSAWLLIDGTRYAPLAMEHRPGRPWQFAGGIPTGTIGGDRITIAVEVEVNPPNRDVETRRSRSVTVELEKQIWPVESGDVLRSATIAEGSVWSPGAAPVWTREIDGDVHTGMVVGKETVMVAVQGTAGTRIEGLDRRTGRELWGAEFSSSVTGGVPPRIVELALSGDGETLYVLLDDRGTVEIHALDSDDGSNRWIGTNLPFVEPPSLLPVPEVGDEKALLVSGFEEPVRGRLEYVVYRLSGTGLILEAARAPVDIDPASLSVRRTDLSFLGYITSLGRVAYGAIAGEQMILFAPGTEDPELMDWEPVNLDRAQSSAGDYSAYLVSTVTADERWSGFVYNNGYYALDHSYRRLVPERLIDQFSIRVNNFVLWEDKWIVFVHEGGGYSVVLLDKLGIEIGRTRLSVEDDYGEEYFVQTFDTQPIVVGDTLFTVDRNYDLFIVDLNGLYNGDRNAAQRVRAPAQVRSAKASAGMLPFGSETDRVTGRYYRQPPPTLVDGQLFVCTGEATPNFLMSYRLRAE